MCSVHNVNASTPMMSAEWAKQACDIWNQQEQLTFGLADDWINNNKNRGFKVLQIYREDCADSPRIELTLESQDDQAICVYGGIVKHTLDKEADYLLYTTTAKWQELGRGDYGPVQAILYDRLRIVGPRQEAMSHLDPFEQFLQVMGKISHDTSCPTY